MALRVADDEGAAGGFDDVAGDDGEVVDLQDAFDLDEQAVNESEVAVGDAADRGDGLGVGEVGQVQGEAELAPVRLRTNASSSSPSGRYWWAKPMRL